MGRRPGTQNRRGKTSTSMSNPGITDLSEGVEKQPESSNLSPEQATLQSEKSSPLETMDPQPKTQANLSAIALAKNHSNLRRSTRLHSEAPSSQDKDIEMVIEDITMSESEEDGEPLDPEEGNLQEPMLVQKSLEEKVDHLFRQFEELKKTSEALKSKFTRDSSPTQSPQAADVRYRDLYFDSQKKIEVLADEKHQLALRLERALGKLEAYEKGACIFSDGLEKMKDVILVSNLTRATEAALKFSSQVFTKDADDAEAKSKRKKTSK